MCSQPSAAITACSTEIAMNTRIAPWEMSLIPKRSTRREFVNAATPMNPAQSANITGMNPGR